MSARTTSYRRALALAIASTAATALGGPVAPDSIAGAGPNAKIRVTGRTLAPVTIRFTSCGAVITNANGTVPRYSSRMAPQANFTIPQVLNGLPVTDLIIDVGLANDPLDPGVLQAAAFDASGMMIMSPLSEWLCANGYNDANQIPLPNFLSPATPLVYYCVDLAAVGTTAAPFVAATPLGTPFVVGPTGKIPGLPAYTFSLTPFVYAGAGWMATSAPPVGLPLTFEGAGFLSGNCTVACYANCDGSVAAPILNVLDFACFLNRYASGDIWANCDNSVTPPVLNVLDFSCFLNRYAAGCP